MAGLRPGWSTPDIDDVSSLTYSDTSLNGDATPMTPTSFSSYPYYSLDPASPSRFTFPNLAPASPSGSSSTMSEPVSQESIQDHILNIPTARQLWSEPLRRTVPIGYFKLDSVRKHRKEWHEKGAGVWHVHIHERIFVNIYRNLYFHDPERPEVIIWLIKKRTGRKRLMRLTEDAYQRAIHAAPPDESLLGHTVYKLFEGDAADWVPKDIEADLDDSEHPPERSQHPAAKERQVNRWHFRADGWVQKKLFQLKRRLRFSAISQTTFDQKKKVLIEKKARIWSSYLRNRPTLTEFALASKVGPTAGTISGLEFNDPTRPRDSIPRTLYVGRNNELYFLKVVNVAERKVLFVCQDGVPMQVFGGYEAREENQFGHRIWLNFS